MGRYSLEADVRGHVSEFVPSEKAEHYTQGAPGIYRCILWLTWIVAHDDLVKDRNLDRRLHSLASGKKFDILVVLEGVADAGHWGPSYGRKA
jgi:hypothetical protein